MKEHEPFIEEALNEMYEKAEKEDAIPWTDAQVREVLEDEYRIVNLHAFEETFPDEP